jgi:hypothetical protein
MSTTMEYMTWLGGTASQTVVDIEPDGRGGVVAAGPTISPDFPITGDAYDPTFDGVRDGWIAVHPMLPALVTRFGHATSPCSTPTWLQVNSAPIAPNPDLQVVTHDAPAGTYGALMLGTPLPGGGVVLGASLFVTPLIAGSVTLADAAGVGRQRLPLPAGFVWTGGIAMQSLWLNPTLCPRGLLTASTALR